MSPEIDWDDFETPAEEAVEKDVIPIGKWICVVTASKPKQMDIKTKPNYSCIGVLLTLEIEQALEIDGLKCSGDVGEEFCGSNLYFEIPFYDESEKPFMKEQRSKIAIKLGLVKTGETLLKSHWKNAVGKHVVITTVENKWTDGKTGEVKTGNPRIDQYNGFAHLDTVYGVSDGNGGENEYSDI